MAIASVGLPAGAEEDLFVEPRPLGPRLASFPWAATFSPDGRWIGMVAGYERSAKVYDATTLEVAWSSASGLSGWTHRGAFTSDSRKFIVIADAAVLVLELRDAGWSLRSRFDLGFDPTLGDMRVSPHWISLSPDDATAVFADAGKVWSVDLRSGDVRRAVPEEGVFSAFLVGDGALAVSTTDPFMTRVVREDGTVREIRGIVLLQPSPDGSRWLVAADESRFDLCYRAEKRDYRLYVEMRSAADQATLGKLELHGRKQEEHNHRLLLQAAFPADASLVATVEGDGSITVRDGATLGPIERIAAYADEQYAMGVAFAPDASLLLTGGRRHGPGVLLWRRATRANAAEDGRRVK